MPGRDKTGPEGQGPLTGRRMGICAGNKENDQEHPRGRGLGWGHGKGGFFRRRHRGFHGNQSEKN